MFDERVVTELKEALGSSGEKRYDFYLAPELRMRAPTDAGWQNLPLTAGADGARAILVSPALVEMYREHLIRWLRP